MGLPAEVREELAAIVARHHTLEQVVRWVLARRPPETSIVRQGELPPTPPVPDVVVQDEFTHDVIVPWRDGLYLVYDTT